MKTNSLVAILAALGLCTSAQAGTPQSAYLAPVQNGPNQASMFVGGTLTLGRNGKSFGRARVAVGISPMARNSTTGNVRIGHGIEFAFAGKGRPSLQLAGADSRQFSKSAQLSGGGKTALIVGGVLVALGVGALLVVDAARDDCGDDCHEH